jgi:hypothetical protein
VIRGVSERVPWQSKSIDALQKMIDDPVIRDTMFCEDGSERSVQRFIEAALTSTAVPVREQYSFGITAGEGDDLAGMVTVSWERRAARPRPDQRSGRRRPGAGRVGFD